MTPKIEALLKAMKKEIWKLTGKSIGLMYLMAVVTAVIAVANGLGQTSFPLIMTVINMLFVELTYTRPRRLEITERYKKQLLEALQEAQQDKT